MVAAISAVDLSQLPPPTVVETLSYESILAQMVADLRLRDPEFTALVESDPAFKVLEVCAYREVLLRARVNAASISRLLAFAEGADLDHMAAGRGLTRLVVIPGNPDAVPPIADVMESDAALKRRYLLLFEAYTTAGSRGSYIFHALSASGDVLDADPDVPEPGQVVVTVLSNSGNGTPSAELLAAVEGALSEETVRPLTDYVSVRAVSLVEVEIDAKLFIARGPDAAVVMDAARSALDALVASAKRIRAPLPLSAIYAALQQPGVIRVQLNAPTVEPDVGVGEAIWVTDTRLTYEVI